MSVARGTRYLEETKQRQQEGLKARTEARIVKLKLTDLEARITDLERFKREIERKSTARSLPCGSAYLFNCILLFLFSSYLSMSLRRPFIAPRSTKTKKACSQTQSEKDKDVTSPMTTGIANEGEGYDQTPISEWRVSDDEEDLVPITQLLATDKQQVAVHRKDNSEWGKRMEKQLAQIERRQQAKERGSKPTIIPIIPCESEATDMSKNGEVLTLSEFLLSEDKSEVENIFVKGHVNFGKKVAKFFGTVLYEGTVSEIIPRRRDFYYKVTYVDGDQEDMDEAELLYAMDLRKKKDNGQDISLEAEGEVELSGLSDDGSVYDSEEDKKALKEAKKKRHRSSEKEKGCSKKKRTTKKKWVVCPESVANIGGPASMLGKSMSRYKF
jgi:hypothetical protein